MKALQLQEVGKVRLIEMDPPRVGQDQMLVRTGAANICTSDLNDIRGNLFGAQLPVVLGHEGAGTVEQVGPKVRHFRAGDRVAAHPVHPCGQCRNCRRGMAHLCSEMGHFGINMPGTFGEYFLVRADRARALAAQVPFTLAALAEPVCVCLEALDQARLPEGGRLLVIGDGPFGAIIARLAGALPLSKIVLAGRHDFRLGFAGPAVVPVNVKKATDALAALAAETDGAGYDAVILAVGTAQAAREGLALLRPKGRLVVFSAVPGQTPVDLFALHVKELEIVGACNDQDKLDLAMEKLADPGLRLGELVTHRFPLAAYQEALALAEHGHDRAMKVALVMEEGR